MGGQHGGGEVRQRAIEQPRGTHSGGVFAVRQTMCNEDNCLGLPSGALKNASRLAVAA